jgi:hypothetical protein
MLRSGSVCFAASWIRIWIRNLFVLIRIRILPSTSKKIKKKPWFLLFWDFFDFLSLKNDVGILKATDKRAGSEAGSASGTAEPYQNVTDPEHCFKALKTLLHTH